MPNVCLCVYQVFLVTDGGPAGQAGDDLGRKEVLTLTGDWDDTVLWGKQDKLPHLKVDSLIIK